MKKTARPDQNIYLLSNASVSRDRGMDVLTLALAQGVDHLQSIQDGKHPGTIIQIVLQPRQCQDLADLLRRKIDLPDHRPN